MKTPGTLLLSLVALSATVSQAQVGNNSAGTSSPALTPASTAVAAPTDYQVVNRGSNFRVWQRNTYEIGPQGNVITHHRQYTELANGLCYKNDHGQWIDSQENIEPFASGAIARQGPYKVIFANNLNSFGAIDQQTPDGKRLRSNILGLEYYDRSSGKSAFFAQVQSSQGQIQNNSVLYPNAFTGVTASVRYKYKKGSFSQEVILENQPPSPESFGLNSDSTEICVVTEFLTPPDATVTSHKWGRTDDTDQDVSWGAMGLGHGKAFDLGETKKLGPQSG